ncbi:MAG: hypothetical protein HN526_16125 [Gammaproteobacteria bacterium]|jgi:hypothetical protein|nr:hypothetical protein [Gammaproteobacteria bacterium]
MIKNILILTLVVINGTLIYAYLTRQPIVTFLPRSSLDKLKHLTGNDPNVTVTKR